MNFTNALGTVSPMVRTCNVTGVYVMQSINNSISDWENGISFYYMLKSNVIRNYTDIDNAAWGLYNSALILSFGEIFYNGFRTIYLLLIQHSPYTTNAN